MTFSISTILITAVLTSFAFYAIMTTLGASALSFESDSLWKFASLHGIFFVFHSGLWMIIASSGVPFLGVSPIFQMFPPEIPPPFPCDPKNCIPAHKVDLAVGNILLFLGGFCIQDDALNKNESDAFKYVVFGILFFSTLNKLRIHYNDWGYIPPIEKEKTS